MDERQEGIAVEYAGFWIRLGAYLIDGILLNIIGFLVAFIAGIIFASAEDDAILVLEFIVGLVISIAYYIGFWTWRGQTPGKIALGIKIIRTDGSSLSLGMSILRYIGYIISAIILLIGYLWIAFDSRKQGIHDKIADTYVIRLPQKKVILPETYA